MRKKPNHTAMLLIGNSPETLSAVTAAICTVLKAAGTEATSVAAMNALIALAKSPDHTSVMNCNFRS